MGCGKRAGGATSVCRPQRSPSIWSSGGEGLGLHSVALARRPLPIRAARRGVPAGTRLLLLPPRPPPFSPPLFLVGPASLFSPPPPQCALHAGSLPGAHVVEQLTSLTLQPPKEEASPNDAPRRSAPRLRIGPLPLPPLFAPPTGDGRDDTPAVVGASLEVRLEHMPPEKMATLRCQIDDPTVPRRLETRDQPRSARVSPRARAGGNARGGQLRRAASSCPRRGAGVRVHDERRTSIPTPGEGDSNMAGGSAVACRDLLIGGGLRRCCRAVRGARPSL